MGLAFGTSGVTSTRSSRRPRSERPARRFLAYARALRALERRDAAGDPRDARQACDEGLREACELLPREARTADPGAGRRSHRG